MEQEQKATLS